MYDAMQEYKLETIRGDCLEVMRTMEDKSVDLIYLDPPFFTQKIQKLKSRDRKKESRSVIFGTIIKNTHSSFMIALLKCIDF